MSLHELKYHPTIGKRLVAKQSMIWYAALSIMALQFLPYLILQSEAYIRIHDTLEGEAFWYQLLQNSGLVFNYSKEAVITQVMNGLPRNVLPTGWSFMMLWIGTCGLYVGYIINYCLIHLIGFVGMYLFLRRYWIAEEEHRNIALGIAVCFSWLPIFSTFGLSVMGQPLLLYALLNTANRRQHWSDFLIVLLFPFYSSIVWAAPPVVAAMAIVYGYYWRKEREHNISLLIVVLSTVLFYLVINFHWFDLLLSPGEFVSHRNEYSYLYSKPLELLSSLKHTFLLLTIGHYHIATMVSLPILLAAFWVKYLYGWKKREQHLLAGILVLAVFYGFYNWLTYYLGESFSLLETFKFERLRIVLPLLYLLLFASLLARMNTRQHSKTIMFFIAAQLLLVIAANDEFQHNVRQLIGQVKKPNFNTFFAPALFENIAAYIGQPKENYRIVQLGLHPSVAQYNGFYTLDSHQSIYDLQYKKYFGKALQAELQKDEVLFNEFNLWGNRCYLYSAEIGKDGTAFMIGKHENKIIKNWQIDTAPLVALGAEYLFSTVEIKNAESIGLQALETFERPSSFWKIHLYKMTAQ